MITSLRGQLAAALALLFVIVLALSSSLIWGTHLVRAHSEHEAYADAQLVAYLQLARAINDYVRVTARPPATGSPEPDGSSAQLAAPLIEWIERIERILALEVALGDRTHAEALARERARVGRARSIVELLNADFARATVAAQDGAREIDPGSLVVLEAVEELRALVDEAVDEERREDAELDRRASVITARASQFAIAAAAAALILAALTGWLVFRGVTRPMRALTEVASRLADGQLDSRVRLQRPAELAHVAQAFNRMAADLERRTKRLEEARSSLERHVKARTAELDGKNRELKRADRSRRRFFADLSHELRTPLTLIRGEAELALVGAADEHGLALRRIHDLSGQMTRLVDDMLFLARSESSDAPPVHLAPVDLRTIVEDAYAQMQPHCAHRLLTLRVDVGDCWIRGDDQRLRQLLRILLDNALRYSRDGDAIELALRRADGSLLLTVADTGPGIEPDALAHLFRRFHRGAQARQLNPTGSGLGLAVAQSIVRAHQGEIAIESTPGAGTTVSVRLLENPPERTA